MDSLIGHFILIDHRCGLLQLASCICSVFRVHSGCSTYHYFLSFYCMAIVHSTVSIHYISCVYPHVYPPHPRQKTLERKQSFSVGRHLGCLCVYIIMIMLAVCVDKFSCGLVPSFLLCALTGNSGLIFGRMRDPHYFPNDSLLYIPTSTRGGFQFLYSLVNVHYIYFLHHSSPNGCEARRYLSSLIVKEIVWGRKRLSQTSLN